MPQRGNPISIEVLGELNFDQFEDRYQELRRRIEADDNARQSWQEKARTVEKQLRGETERKNPPWPGACTLAPPLTKKLLRRWVPSVYNLVAEAEPVASFLAGEPQAAIQAPVAEMFFDWLIKVRMDGFLEQVALLANGVGSKGQDYIVCDWDYRTELETRVALTDQLFGQNVPTDITAILQKLVSEYDIQDPAPETQQQLMQAAAKIMQGAKAVKISYRRVIADYPRARWFPTEQVIVPPQSGQPYDAEYVCLMHDMTPDQLRCMARDGILNPQAVEALLQSVGDNQGLKPTAAVPNSRVGHETYGDQLKSERALKAGVNEVEAWHPIRIHQVYCLLDWNGDGTNERVILWYSPADPNIRLAVHEFPFSFRRWPVVRFNYEMVDSRPYLAQGMGQQLESLQSQYTQQYRATADAIDIQLAPVFKARITSNFVPRNIKWGPGKIIPVNSMEDFAPVEKSPFNLHQYLQDRGEVKMFAEEMAGDISAELAASGPRLERRTATEVQAVAGSTAGIKSMDAALWQLGMARVYQIIWEMWMDLGPREVYFAVVGEKLPDPFRKSEYNYKYQLIPTGTPGNTDRQGQLSRALSAMQILGQFAPQIANWDTAVHYVMRLLEPRMARALVLTKMEQAMQQTLQSAAAMIAQGPLPASLQQFAAPASPGGGPAG
jgi:hypothetical protein